MATSLDSIDYKPFQSSQKVLLDSAGSVQVTARRHCAQAEGTEGREVSSRQNTQDLRGHGEESGFYSLADGSHGRLPSKGGSYLMCSLGVHSICCVHMGLLAGGVESGMQVGSGHTWTSGVSAVISMGEVGLCFVSEPEDLLMDDQLTGNADPGMRICV